MKILNLDKLNKGEGRELVIFGETHAVTGMTVENFVATTEAAEKLKGENSLVKQVEATIAMVLRSVPTVSVENLKRLELPQLQAIVSFIRGEEVEGVESSKVEQAEDADEKK